eukprot:TRINITY_DN3526_c0_g1_i1.p7 TRINITY_DN3526_c0_g1~~TRINITY_DN3526_c0_g1_i1.p7  ORF type:complete len:105 (-),score=7.87 TRINITY_DN3526_c0_g1_i1:244-558(-)
MVSFSFSLFSSSRILLCSLTFSSPSHSLPSNFTLQLGSLFLFASSIAIFSGSSALVAVADSSLAIPAVGSAVLFGQLITCWKRGGRPAPATFHISQHAHSPAAE